MGPQNQLTVRAKRGINVMTANSHGTRNEIPSPLDSGNAGLPIRRLGGLLGGRLEQTPVRLHGHGRPGLSIIRRPAPQYRWRRCQWIAATLRQRLPLPRGAEPRASLTRVLRQVHGLFDGPPGWSSALGRWRCIEGKFLALQAEMNAMRAQLATAPTADQ